MSQSVATVPVDFRHFRRYPGQSLQHKMRQRMSGSRPRTREEAQAEIDRVRGPPNFAEQRARAAELWPWNSENWPEAKSVPPASSTEVKAAIRQCIEDAGGSYLGIEKLWAAVRDKLPGRRVTRRTIENLRPKDIRKKRGRPPREFAKK